MVFAVGGIAFPIGVLIYWTTSNLWTMGQQFYVIRNNPAPGTPASKAKEERDAEKAARKGVAATAPRPPQRATTVDRAPSRAGSSPAQRAAAQEADAQPAPQKSKPTASGATEHPTRTSCRARRR